MSSSFTNGFSRRAFLASGAAAFGMPALAQDVFGGSTVEMERDINSGVRRNISSFRALDWRPYFSNLHNGASSGRYVFARFALLGSGWANLQALSVERSDVRGIDSPGPYQSCAQDRRS